jgi:hypothetical protein
MLYVVAISLIIAFTNAMVRAGQFMIFSRNPDCY